MPTFLEFFAGGGMAGEGLGPDWQCLLANDICPKKGSTYTANHGGERLRIGCISQLDHRTIPAAPDLAWASFPCQDLSLAGPMRGLDGTRSGAFWPFWALMRGLIARDQGPTIIALENVPGLLSTNGGRDFADIVGALASAGYRVGAVVLDAQAFVPQSRKRVFVLGYSEAVEPPFTQMFPSEQWHPDSLLRAHDNFDQISSDAWLWLNPPLPRNTAPNLGEVIEDEPEGVEWFTDTKTATILAMMDAVNRTKLDYAMRSQPRLVGAIYKRTRPDGSGGKRQRAEIRFDVAGCLRTPGGGSSRQIVLVADRNGIRTRLLSPREAARLMGLRDTYILPSNYNEAYHLLGDGVVVPAVNFIATHLIEPALRSAAVPV
jgi:DNA (cytosine-5)-methyltransferase 1